jgi:enoyl-CoA hydratase
MSEERQELLTHANAGIGYLRFNRPAKHNAISFDMWCGMAEAIDNFAADDSVRVIILSGEGGRAFSSGADISQFEKQRTSPDAVEVYNAAIESATSKLTQILKPTIASIQGYCMGGGLGTALCCDLRIATSDSVFAIPAAKLGVGYAYDSLANLTNLVGPAFAKEIMFTGRQFTADEAYHTGLINRVIETDQLETATAELAESMVNNAPLTIKACKRIIAEVAKDPDQRDIPACDQMVTDCFESDDYKEGRKAFNEKRKPKFQGK